VSVLLVRHAAAGDRDQWTAPDEERPLSPEGERQAAALVDTLAGFDVTRILSSPYLRCTQTVDPLAAARGLEVEARGELAEGGGHATCLLVLGLLEGPDVVLCTHGDVMEDVLDGLGVDRPEETRKGATWVLGATGAHHLPPPG
jgi:phosphohistidine phosphatase SixA